MLFFVQLLILILAEKTLTINHNHHHHHRLIVFSFDGFRSDYVDINNTPNLFKLAKTGVRGHMRSTFVTKTFPNHQSIATGLYQPWHGIVNNYFVDPNNLTIEPFSVQISSSTFYWDMFNKTVPIYIANQLNDPKKFSGAMQWPGSAVEYTDGKNPDKRYRVQYLKKFQHNYDWVNNIETVLKWLTSPTKPANFVMIYFDEPDSTSHPFGPFSDQVKKIIKRIDDIIGYFIKRLQQLNLNKQTDLIILSDHGMVEISMERVIYLEECNQLFHGLEYKLVGASPVFSIIPIAKPFNTSKKTDLIDSVKEALEQCSKQLFNNHFKIYKQKDIPDKYRYKYNRRILPLFMYADEGYELVENKKEWNPKYPVWGGHGYDNTLKSMQPLFIAKGPSFKINYEHLIKFNNVDLYPLMLSILKISPNHLFYHQHNGTFANVRDMLVE